MQGEIRCSPAELLYLASLLGVETLLGAPNPFEGRLASEVDTLLAEAVEGLMRRGLLLKNEAGDMEVDGWVADLVLVCGRPDRTVVLTCVAPGEEPALRYFHCSGGRVAEAALALNGESVLQYVPDNLLTVILDTLGVRDREAPCTQGGRLREEDLTQARDLAAQGLAADAAGALEAAGLPGSVAWALSETLAHPVANGAVATIVPGSGDWSVQGLSLLAGQNGLWMLRPGQDDSIEVVPAHGEQAKDAISALIGLQVEVANR